MKYSGVFFILILLLAPFSSWGDGGTLFFRKSQENFKIPRYSSDLSLDFTSNQRAKARLDDHTQIEVFPVGSPYYQGTYFFTCKAPYRLLIDRNHDNLIQPDEISEGMSLGPQAVVFDGVESSLYLNGIEIPVLIRIQAQFIGNNIYVTIREIASHYAGNLTLGSETYSACLVFIPQLTYLTPVASVVLLDSNKDGVFQLTDDLWFTAQGFLFPEKDLWVAKTVLSATSAEVSLTPYTGPTGTLKVEGEGICSFDIANQSLSPHSTNPGTPQGFVLHLLPCGDRVYPLPSGQYNIVRSQVIEKEMTLSTNASIPFDSSFSIYSDQQTPLNLGGPLRCDLSLQKFQTLNRVYLSFGGFSNANGILYSPIVEESSETLLLGNRPPAPEWEIHDSKNEVVKKGRFEYG